MFRWNAVDDLSLDVRWNGIKGQASYPVNTNAIQFRTRLAPAESDYGPWTNTSWRLAKGVVWDSSAVFYVQAKDAAGNVTTANTGLSGAPPQSSPPLAPTGVSATPGPGNILLSWPAVPTATSYSVKRSLTPGGSYTVLANAVTGLSYPDSPLTAGTPYYYVIAANNSYGTSPNSAEVSATPAPLPPAAPNVSISRGISSLALNWPPAANATSYNVGRSTTSGGPYTPIASALSSTTYTDSGLPLGIVYYYVVTAQNVSGTASSSEVSGTPKPPLPNAPTGVNAAPGVNNIVVSWASVSNASSYSVKRSSSAGGPFSVLAANLTTLNYTDSSLSNGTYYYTVTATNETGGSPDSSMVSASPNPPLPAAPVVSLTRAVNGLILNWPPAANAATYIVGRRTSSIDPYTWIKIDLTGLTYTDNAVALGTVYYYVVIAQNDTGTGPNSAEVSGAPKPPLPAAPTGVAATPAVGNITVSWSPVANASSYAVKRSLSAGGPYAPLVDNLTTLNYTDTTVALGTTYYYVVAAANETGTGPDSGAVSASPAPPIPAAPTVTLTRGINSLILNWPPVANAASYSVYRSTNPGGPYTPVAPGLAVLSFTDSAVTLGTTYYYVVTAQNITGTSPNSAEVSGAPAPPVPAAPTGVAAAPGVLNILVSWASVPNASSYIVKRSSTPGGPYVPLPGSMTSLNYTDNSVALGTTYYYVVAASNETGTGSDSGEVSASPNPPLPAAAGGVQATAGINSITITWSPASYATSYIVKRRTSAEVTFSVLANNVTTTSYPDNGLSSSTTYFYLVEGRNVTGTGADSAIVSATPNPTPPPIPAAPSGVTASATVATVVGNSTVTVKWTAVPNAASYSVKRGTSATGPWTTVASASITTSFSETLPADGAQYFYVVNASNSAGTSADSSAASVQLLPPTPAGLSVSVSTNRRAQLAWADRSSDEQGFSIESLSNGTWTQIGTAPANSTSFTQPGTLARHTTYSYRVQAYNASGNTAYSNTATVTSP